MNSRGTIGVLPMFSIMILAVGLMNHVIVIPPLIQDAKRDAWVSVLIILVPYMLWTSLLYYIMKKTNQELFLSWIKLNFGKLIYRIISGVFVIYLLFISSLTLKETVMWTHISYLPRTPVLMLAISMIILCSLAVHLGLEAIAITAGVLLPLIIVLGHFVMTTNLKHKNYHLLTPILENGWSTVLEGCIYVGGGSVEIITFLLIQHELKKKIRLRFLIAVSLFLILLVFGPVTGAIAEFGPFEAAELRFPAFEEWRLVEIGKYIRHVDFLSIYQWISGAFIRISFSMYLVVEILTAYNKQTKSKYVWLALLGIGLICITAGIPIKDTDYLAFLKTVYLPTSLYVITGLLIMFFIMVTISNMKRKE
ncbi:GerAB/ArcD/ProY family transporter [Paenibacillus cremeus]|nr:endospore germination permease [Paenibacillus cremeus]